MGNANRNNNIGTLHLIGALFVMLGHQCVLLGQAMPTLFDCLFLAIGVKIIFLISGYLITKSLWGMKKGRLSNAGRYVYKRLSRIYPEYLGCLAVTTLIIGPLFTQVSISQYFALRNELWYYFINNIKMFPIYGLPGLFVNSPNTVVVNGSIWTLPVELVMYLVILLIYLCSDREKVRKYVYLFVTVLSVLVCGIRMYLAPSMSLVYYGTDWIQALNVIPYYLIGGLISLFDVKRFFNVPIGAVLLMCFGPVAFRVQVIDEFVCMILLTYFVFALIFAQKQDLALKYIKSEYAYGVYLYGFPIQQCVLQALYLTGYVANFWLLFVLSVGLTYAVAAVTYQIFYKPVLMLNKKIGV